jgi:hypothetical protein
MPIGRVSMFVAAVCLVSIHVAAQEITSRHLRREAVRLCQGRDAVKTIGVVVGLLLLVDAARAQPANAVSTGWEKSPPDGCTVPRSSL